MCLLSHASILRHYQCDCKKTFTIKERHNQHLEKLFIYKHKRNYFQLIETNKSKSIKKHDALIKILDIGFIRFAKTKTFRQYSY